MQKLQRQWDAGKFLCVGLDPDISQMPAMILERHLSSEVRLYDFCCAIVEATKDVTAAYKLNRAFFEAYGSVGTRGLELVAEFIHLNAPYVPIILDAKYGDVPHSNEMYAQFAYDGLGVDAVTASPYLGLEALEPFMRYNKGVFVLCRTSNPFSRQMQEQTILPSEENAEKWGIRQERVYIGVDETVSSWPYIELYKKIAYEVAESWSELNLGLVVGGTDLEALRNVREIAPELPLLIPGIGAQGGDLDVSVKAAADSNGKGFLISASRSIIYASDGKDFAEAAGQAAGDLHRQITAAFS